MKSRQAKQYETDEDLRYCCQFARFLLRLRFASKCVPTFRLRSYYGVVDFPERRFLDVVKNNRSGEASMRPTALYRIAGVLLIVCAALNAYGLSRFWRVAGSMNPVSFPVGHRPLTYAQVVLGLGLFWSVCFLFGAYLAWHLGTLARKTPQATGALGWGLFAYEVVGIVISWIALAGLAHVVLIATVLCIGWATWLSTGTPSASAIAKSRTLEIS